MRITIMVAYFKDSVDIIKEAFEKCHIRVLESDSPSDFDIEVEDVQSLYNVVGELGVHLFLTSICDKPCILI